MLAQAVMQHANLMKVLKYLLKDRINKFVSPEQNGTEQNYIEGFISYNCKWGSSDQFYIMF